MSVYIRIIEALWFILPAYVANSVPVQIAKIPFLEKYSQPVDFGKTFQGRRIFGDSKTWRGLIFGIFFGTIVAIIQFYFQVTASEFFGTTSLPKMSLELGFMLSVGALIGDLISSFVKRRVGLGPGEPAPLLDQLNFVFGAYFFSYFLVGIDYEQFFVVLFITPTLHLFFNALAWIYKLKKNPW